MSSPNEPSTANSGPSMTGPDYMYDAENFRGMLMRRFYAFLYDMVALIFLAAIGLVISLVLTVLTLGLAAPIMGVLWVVLFFAYFTLTLGGPRSATPGMVRQGIEMRTWEGKHPSHAQALFHTFLFYIVFSVTSIVFVLVPLFNARRRNLHDFFSGSVFINSGVEHAEN